MGMSLWKKIILSLLTLLVLLVAGLAAIFFFWLGPAAKALVENIGPKALGTRVEIESLSINPRKGTLDLVGFQIGTYNGFSHTNTWELADLHVSIDVRSLFSDTILIHSIELKSPHFTYEQNEVTDNVSEFIRNIQDFAKIDPNQPKKAKDEKLDPPEKTKKRVIIEGLKITDLQMHLANTDHPELDIQLGAEQVSLCLTNGLIQLDHLVLSDPSLLSTPNATEIEGISIQLDADSIYSDTLVIEEVQITKPYAYFEQNPETDTLIAFMQIADTFAADFAPATPEKEKKPKTKNAAPVVLRKLNINDLRLHLVNTANSKLNMVFKLNQVAINTTQATGDLEGLSISNPSELVTPNLFELESIHIKMDPTTILSDTVIIEELLVQKPHAFLEKNQTTDSVTELIKIADRFVAGSRASAPAPTTQTKKSQNKAQTAPVKLCNLEINDLQLNLLDSTKTNTPATLRTLAAIGQINAKLETGNLQIENITIPNSPGFSATNLFQLARIQVTIDPATLFSNPVAIKTVFVDSPQIHLQQTSNSGNLSELLKTLNGFIPSTESGQTTPPPDSEKTSNPRTEQPVVFNALQITNFTVHIIAPSPTQTLGEELTQKKGIGKRLHLDQINPLGQTESNKEEPEEEVSIDLLSFDLLNLEPRKGLLEISNLEIGNTKDFSNKNLAMFQHYRMDFSPDSLQSNVFIIEDIIIDQPKVAYERKITTDNIAALQKLIESIIQRKKSYDGSQKEPELVGPPNPKNTSASGEAVIIEHLELSKGIVRAKISKLPTIPVIPLNFEINDLGKEQGGIGVQDAFGMIVSTFYDAIVSSVGNATGIAGDTLKGAGNLTLDSLGTLTGGLIGTDKKDKAKEPK